MPDVTLPGAASTGGPATTLRVAVTVGTDYHPFDRLIEWINDWLGQHPEQAGTFFVQSGTAVVSPACAGERFLDVDQLNALLDWADVVVCHGGPGSIADAWSRGHLPIVVPRLRRHREVVDDHQVDFCAKLAELGRVRLAQTPAALAELLDEAAPGESWAWAAAQDADIEAAVARFAVLVDDLVSRPARRRRLYRAGRTRREPISDAGTPAIERRLPTAADVPEQPAISHASRSPAHAGLAGVPKEEQE